LNIDKEILNDNGLGAETVMNSFEGMSGGDTEVLVGTAIRVLSLEYEIKMLRDDIKHVKSELKDKDIKVKDLNEAIKMIKEKYKPKKDLTEAEQVFEALDDNDEVVNLVNNLVGD